MHGEAEAAVFVERLADAAQQAIDARTEGVLDHAALVFLHRRPQLPDRPLYTLARFFGREQTIFVFVRDLATDHQRASLGLKGQQQAAR